MSAGARIRGSSKCWLASPGTLRKQESGSTFTACLPCEKDHAFLPEEQGDLCLAEVCNSSFLDSILLAVLKIRYQAEQCWSLRRAAPSKA